MATPAKEIMSVENWHLNHIHGIAATILTVIVLVIAAIAYGGWLLYKIAIKDIAAASAAVQYEFTVVKGAFQELSATVHGTVNDLESTLRNTRGTLQSMQTALQSLGTTMNRTATTMSTLRAPNQAVHIPS